VPNSRLPAVTVDLMLAPAVALTGQMTHDFARR
jgi:hypothetical protein